LIKINNSLYELNLIGFNNFQIQLEPNEKNSSLASLLIVDESLHGDESALVQVLKEQSYSAADLIPRIYGERSHTAQDYWLYLNRLRQLIARVRRKYPTQLKYRRGCYYWAGP
jgi:hypothetical protein